MTRPIPTIALKFIEREEGQRAMPYQDSAGVWTDGVGNTQNVQPGVPVSQTTIDTDLTRNLGTALERLTWAIGPTMVSSLNDYQFSALLSFVFNEGEKADWTVWADIRKGDLADVPSQLAEFVYAGGQRVQGLVNRRAAEVALWNGTDPLCRDYPVAA